MTRFDPSAQVAVILNPHAKWNQAGQMADRLTQLLEAAALPFVMQTTNAPNHAIALAKAAVDDGARVIVAAGGDGTVSEVINGIASADEAAQKVAFSAFPIGTGNDFAAMAGIPLDLDEASRRIATYLHCGEGTRCVDIAQAQIETRDGQQMTRYIGNSMGLGLEAQVTIESHRAKYLPSSIVYVVGALRAIMRHATAQLQIEWEAENGERCSYEGDTLMLSAGNSPRVGGGFYMTRDAVMDDGLLDLAILGGHLSRRQMIGIMLRAMRNEPFDPGEVRAERCRRVTLTCPGGTPIHVDGEVLTECATQIDVQLLPGRLTVLGESKE